MSDSVNQTPAYTLPLRDQQPEQPIVKATVFSQAKQLGVQAKRAATPSAIDQAGPVSSGTARHADGTPSHGYASRPQTVAPRCFKGL